MNKKIALLSFQLSFLMSNVIHSCQNQTATVAPDMCQYVLKMTKIPAESPSIPHTFMALDKFFKERNINNYADAAKFGRTNHILDEVDTFNTKMSTLFIKNHDDIVPKDSKKYQALILNTSGIDVFMQRLAFLSRLTKSHKIQTDELIALIGTHPHRQDLINVDYLAHLPNLFGTDFDLASYDRNIAKDIVSGDTPQWTHRDGMRAAWQLVECDSTMKNLKNKFRYFSVPDAPAMQTEELIKHFIMQGLTQPVTQENPIAFVVTPQAASTMKTMVEKIFPNAEDGTVDILISRPVADHIEEKLFNDTPQQRAMTKLFAFYCLLKTMK